jgi:hypothetical protein
LHNDIACDSELYDPTTGVWSRTGAFQFVFTGTHGAAFTALAAANLALPLSNWTVLGKPQRISAGQFQFTDPQATNNRQRFYRVRSL